MVPPPEESRKKMKKYTLNITAAMLFALVTISPALVGMYNANTFFEDRMLAGVLDEN